MEKYMEKSISNMFYCLSHHPEISEKVKKRKYIRLSWV